MKMNSLTETHPELAEEFHPTKNNISIDEISYGSKIKVWWLGRTCNHEWLMSPLSRSSGQGCAVCSGKQVQPGVNDLVTVYPELVRYWHFNKNDIPVPDGSTSISKKVFWILDCGHEKFVSAKILAAHPKCLICANRVIVKGVNDLATTYPDLTSLWHPSLNNGLTPEETLPSSGIKVWWKGECHHEWFASPKTVIASKTVCPYCGKRELLKGFNDLATVNPEILPYWHSTKNVIAPDSVLPGSHTKIWLKGTCGHEWEKEVRRALPVQCPYCSHGGKLLTGFNDFGTLSPELAQQWHPTKNTVTVQSIRNKSDYKGWWLGECDQGHSYLMTPAERTRGRGCPECAAHSYSSKAETELYEFITKTLGLSAKQNDRTVIKGELDINIPSHKIAIEFNGLYWHNEFAGRDKYYHQEKWKSCKEKGIQLIQIWEDEWTRNPELVKRMLAYKLGVSQERKISARNTKVVELTNEQTAVFLNANHIQGALNGGVRLGLVEKGNPGPVLAVMVLKSEPGSEGKVLNLLRFATSQPVPGGFTKLLKHVERNLNPHSIITFSDNCVSDGGLYKNNEFIPVKELEPDYKYVVNGERVHKFRYRVKKFKDDPNIRYEEGLSERELALLNRIPRIWDAGKIKWMKRIV